MGFRGLRREGYRERVLGGCPFRREDCRRHDLEQCGFTRIEESRFPFRRHAFHSTAAEFGYHRGIARVVNGDRDKKRYVIERRISGDITSIGIGAGQGIPVGGFRVSRERDYSRECNKNDNEYTKTYFYYPVHSLAPHTRAGKAIIPYLYRQTGLPVNRYGILHYPD